MGKMPMTGNAKDVATCIGPVCLEFQKLALNANLPVLAYILGMAVLEANTIASGEQGGAAQKRGIAA